MEVRQVVRLKGPLFEGKSAGIIQHNLDAAITEMVMFLVPKIKAGIPRDTGILEQSVIAEFEGKGTPIVKGVIGTAMPYGLATEKGRRPGKGIPKDLDLSRWIMRKFGVDEKQAKSLNYVVKRAIVKNGTIKRFNYKGAEMFEKALEDNWSQLQSISAGYGMEMVKELSGG